MTTTESQQHPSNRSTTRENGATESAIGYVWVGNTATELSDGRWEWQLYLREDDPCCSGEEEGGAGGRRRIERVRIHLHRTFSPNERDLVYLPCERSWMSQRFVGWGTFVLRFALTFQGEEGEGDDACGTAHFYKHTLVFQSGGSGPIQTEIRQPVILPPPSFHVQPVLHVNMEGADKQHGSVADTARLARKLFLQRSPPSTINSQRSPTLNHSNDHTSEIDTLRREINQRLSKTCEIPPPHSPTLHPGLTNQQYPTTTTGDIRFFHGRAYTHNEQQSGPLRPPVTTWHSIEAPRGDHTSPQWLTASEFRDGTNVLEAKVAQLALLLTLSKRTVVYSGAGISVAAGIGQAAVGSSSSSSSSSNTIPQESRGNIQIRPLNALPTKTHYALAAMARYGLIHGWIQQNHDGLPQKAGYPQEMINEIHGSWFDPSNPVVKYSGELRKELYQDMLSQEINADLVLVIGTSLSGLNADRVPLGCCRRAGGRRYDKRSSLGSVMINLQQTPHDGKMTLKISETSDVVFSRVVELLDIGRTTPCRNCGTMFCPKEGIGYMYDRSDTTNNDSEYQQQHQQHRWDLLLRQPGLPIRPVRPTMFPESNRVLVPYDKDGNRINDDDPDQQRKRMIWDLSPSAKVRLHPDHNVVGCQQPAYAHIGQTPGHGTVMATRNGTGGGVSETCCAYTVVIEGKSMSLGVWWVEAAVRGAVRSLPVINLHPEFVYI